VYPLVHAGLDAVCGMLALAVASRALNAYRAIRIPRIYRLAVSFVLLSAACFFSCMTSIIASAGGELATPSFLLTFSSLLSMIAFLLLAASYLPSREVPPLAVMTPLLLVRYSAEVVAALAALVVTVSITLEFLDKRRPATAASLTAFLLLTASHTIFGLCPEYPPPSPVLIAQVLRVVAYTLLLVAISAHRRGLG